jgi:hypothetical protein
MKNHELSPLDQVIATMYGDIWRSSPIFGTPLRDPKPEARPQGADPETDR